MIEMNKITMQKDGTLSVPDVPVVPYITGDGVGAEVTPSMQSVVNAAVQKAYGGKRRIEWKEVLALSLIHISEPTRQVRGCRMKR